jgi:hypothetical protein
MDGRARTDGGETWSRFGRIDEPPANTELAKMERAYIYYRHFLRLSD